MRYSAMQISTRKRNRLNDLAYKSEVAYVQAMSSILPFRAVRRKCFYVYLNIRLMRYSAKQIILYIWEEKKLYKTINNYKQCKYKRATRKCNGLNDLAYKSESAYVEDAFARPMLASY